MPANQFNGYQDYGIGLGLRVPHYNHILEQKPVCDWFEIISETFMVDGGRPLEVLDEILEQYRVVQHLRKEFIRFSSLNCPNYKSLNMSGVDREGDIYSSIRNRY